MNGGYFQVYLEIDLTKKDKKQTISGAYQLVKSAVESGKPIILYGADTGGVKLTPIPIFGWFDGTTYIFVAPICTISIEDDDGITITVTPSN